jgi:hypothetical protein
MRDLPQKAMLEALDQFFELYLPHLEGFHQEGPRARAFRVEFQASHTARRHQRMRSRAGRVPNCMAREVRGRLFR